MFAACLSGSYFCFIKLGSKGQCCMFDGVVELRCSGECLSMHVEKVRLSPHSTSAPLLFHPCV